jgi:hypothetical protein
MVLYSSSGWEQQQLRRQMKCTINNSNTFFTIFQVINIRCFLHSHPNQAPHFTLTKLADNPLESHSPPPMKQLSATNQIRENRYICKSHKSRLLSGNRKIAQETQNYQNQVTQQRKTGRNKKKRASFAFLRTERWLWGGWQAAGWLAGRTERKEDSE